MMRVHRLLIAAGALAFGMPAAVLAAPSGQCDESCMLKLADSVVEAVAAKDYRRVSWADPVRYTENNVPLMIGDAWWGSTGSTVGQKAFAMADTQTGNVIWIGTIWDHDAPSFGAIRIGVSEGKVAEVELIAARTPWPIPFGDPKKFSMSASMTGQVAADRRRSRERLIDVADSYLSTKQRNNGTLLAEFAPSCAMVENGVQIASVETDVKPKSSDCAAAFRAGLFAPVERVRDRRFPVVDTERGLVLAISVQDLPAREKTFTATDGRKIPVKRDYPMSRLVAELVRIEGDKVVRSEGVAASLPYYMPTPWNVASSPGAPPAASSSTALERRVQQLEDEKQIREVIIRYGEYLDARDYAGYASLFASDGVWTGGFGSAKGPAAIQEMLEKNLGKPEAGFINKSNFHLVTTAVVDVDGDTAKARSRYLFFTASTDNRPAATLAGRYFDEFVREKGEWKIKSRTSHGVIPYRDGNDPNRPPPPPSLNGIIKQ
jgi:ketosteroid isomerase-like protein